MASGQQRRIIKGGYVARFCAPLFSPVFRRIRFFYDDDSLTERPVVRGLL